MVFFFIVFCCVYLFFFYNFAAESVRVFVFCMNRSFIENESNYE